ncbi:MAG: hypothetical protein KJ607_06480 [Bacteroidetes bacterium]|nr:hypothetical protein [Bacteroidota bacterium]
MKTTVAIFGLIFFQLFGQRVFPQDTILMDSLYGCGGHDEPFVKCFHGKRYNGVAVSLFENGNYRIAAHYKGGLEHGLWTEYYEDGSIKVHGQRKNFKYDGLWKEYYADGTLKSTRNHLRGSQTGLHKQWYEDGSLWSISYRNEKGFSGFWQSLDKDGYIYEEKFYIDNKPVNPIKFLQYHEKDKVVPDPGVRRTIDGKIKDIINKKNFAEWYKDLTVIRNVYLDDGSFVTEYYYCYLFEIPGAGEIMTWITADSSMMNVINIPVDKLLPVCTDFSGCNRLYNTEKAMKTAEEADRINDEKRMEKMKEEKGKFVNVSNSRKSELIFYKGHFAWKFSRGFSEFENLGKQTVRNSKGFLITIVSTHTKEVLAEYRETTYSMISVPPDPPIDNDIINRSVIWK